jgi:hypothetical protein
MVSLLRRKTPSMLILAKRPRKVCASNFFFFRFFLPSSSNWVQTRPGPPGLAHSSNNMTSGNHWQGFALQTTYKLKSPSSFSSSFRSPEQHTRIFRDDQQGLRESTMDISSWHLRHLQVHLRLLLYVRCSLLKTTRLSFRAPPRAGTLDFYVEAAEVLIVFGHILLLLSSRFAASLSSVVMFRTLGSLTASGVSVFSLLRF